MARSAAVSTTSQRTCRTCFAARTGWLGVGAALTQQRDFATHGFGFPCGIELAEILADTAGKIFAAEVFSASQEQMAVNSCWEKIPSTKTQGIL